MGVFTESTDSLESRLRKSVDKISLEMKVSKKYSPVFQVVSTGINEFQQFPVYGHSAQDSTFQEGESGLSCYGCMLVS